jgi:hypothetical protein
MKKLFSVDPLTGRHTIAHMNDDGGLVLETKQDVSNIIESNKREYNDITSLDRFDDRMTKVARLPLTVVDDLNRKGIMRGFLVTNEKEFRAFLNDPDNRFFRTRPGKL